MQKAFFIIATFILAFIVHLLYFKLVNFGCAGGKTEWFTTYLRLQEYYLGFSYAVSAAFAAFAFMKFKECKRKAVDAGIGVSVWAIALWTLGCFLAGCCGSPIWIIYINLLGISMLKIPKWSVAITSLVMVALGYLWLKKKLPKYRPKDNGETNAG